MPILKIERASVVITPEARELHLLTCLVCSGKFYGRENQKHCDACSKSKPQPQKLGRPRLNRGGAAKS